MKDYLTYTDLTSIGPGLIFYNKFNNRACIVTENDGLGVEVEELAIDPDAGLILKTIRQHLEVCRHLPSTK